MSQEQAEARANSGDANIEELLRKTANDNQ